MVAMCLFCCVFVPLVNVCVCIIRVGVLVNWRVFRGSGSSQGNTLAVRGVSPQSVLKLVSSFTITGHRHMGNISARQRWMPATKVEYDEYILEFGPAYVRTKDCGAYELMVLDIFDGNHRWHATSQLIRDGTLRVKDVYFQTAVYEELLPDVVAELTGKLLNEYVRFIF